MSSVSSYLRPARLPVTLLALLCIALALPAVTAAQDLEVKMITAYDPLWNDAGSGSERDGSFWRPMPMDGWYRVGHHLKANYGAPGEPTMVVRPLAGDIIAYPVDFQMVWNDGGSGSNADGSVWRAVCPSGFHALGDVAQLGYGKPSLKEIVCINSSQLERAEIGSMLWNDGGSGGDIDFSGWSIKSPASYASSGLFIGNGSYAAPSVGLFYAIK